MSFGGPNLAREPFVNARPVRRTAAALGVAALLLLGWNTLAYRSSGAGAADKAAELERLRRSSAQARERVETLEADLRRADLTRANARTTYLNERISERAFSWNLLVDRLTETMPRGVRLVRLAPAPFKDERRVREATSPPPAERRVTLQIVGETEDDESLLEFVDRLFAHPAFERPNLSREARVKSGGLGFTIAVAYLPAMDLPGTASAAALAATLPAVATAPPAAGAAPSPAPLFAPGVPAGVAAVAPPPATGRAGAAPAAVAAGARPPTAAAAASAPAEREPRSAAEPASARAVAAAAAERPTPAPATSIFGVPLPAGPYASGGTR